MDPLRILLLMATVSFASVMVTRWFMHWDANRTLYDNMALSRQQLTTAVERAEEFEKKYKLAHTDVFRMWAIIERAHKECEAVRLAYLPFPGANMPAREREALRRAEDEYAKAKRRAGLAP